MSTSRSTNGLRASAIAVLSLALAGCLSGGGGGGNSSSAAPAPAPAAATNPTPAAQSAPAGPSAPPQPLVALPAEAPTTDQDAVRFLEQSTFGPTEAAVQEVQRKGAARALAEQFNQPIALAIA